MPTDLQGHFHLHNPERQPDAVPSEIAKAAEWFQFALRPDVAGKKFRSTVEAKGRANTLELTHMVVQCLPQALKTITVYKHHPVHELHPIAAARFEHLSKFRQGTSAGFFTNNVFARFSSAQYPFSAQSRRYRKIDRIHFLRRDQFLVRAKGYGRGFHGHLRLALGNEFAAAFEITTGHSGDSGIAG